MIIIIIILYAIVLRFQTFPRVRLTQQTGHEHRLKLLKVLNSQEGHGGGGGPQADEDPVKLGIVTNQPAQADPLLFSAGAGQYRLLPETQHRGLVQLTLPGGLKYR